MNKANLKSYAPKARLDFIKAVTERANVLGISAAGAVPAEVRGDVALIDGREWPAKVAGQRDELIARIKRHGFEQTIDEVAYTWFNRFAALRYMEIHDYLGHGWRVLSSRDGGLPEILRHASELTLPGLNADRAREMQLAGNQDNELYKLLLVAQCNELSRVMPFLFERIDDETELLLPENLLRTDSIVAKLVEQVPEEDWQEIEVVGWLYQFYISEKKDQVIGKVVKSEDIPAATQLFTPNWIVQYLVQNSVGRLWLMANPNSTLASQWPYYIQPAEQTPEVQAQLDALIQTRIREDGETLNPETITVLDPACGSGHILVVAYDVLKAIYLERGYQPRSIPRLILEKNLYGLDIDDRAGQLAAFALLMKARADDRRLFMAPPKLNVLSMQESAGLDLAEIARCLADFGVQRTAIKALLDTFRQAKTFGSLIQLPAALRTAQLKDMAQQLETALGQGDLYAVQAASDLVRLVNQASILGMSFDAVAANPPYMGGRGMNKDVKEFAAEQFHDSRADLFSMFLERGFTFTKSCGLSCMITMQSWMFLSSFESMRAKALRDQTLVALLQLPYDGKGPTAMGISFGVVASVFQNTKVSGIRGDFDCLRYYELTDDGSPRRFPSRNERNVIREPDLFFGIPGSPIAYWLPRSAYSAFSHSKLLDVGKTRRGLQTGNKDRYIRYWFECDLLSVELRYLSKNDAAKSSAKWFMFNNGGDFRRWYGNLNLVVNWARDGEELKGFSGSIIPSEDLYFAGAVAWPRLTSGDLSFRLHPEGIIPGDLSPCYYATDHYLNLAYLNSKCASYFLNAINPTMTSPVGDVAKIPAPFLFGEAATVAIKNAKALVEIYKADWDQREESWGFQKLAWLTRGRSDIESAWNQWSEISQSAVSRARELEEANNQLFAEAYDLQTELNPAVDAQQITLARADREIDSQRLISYALGCIMGRYSLADLGVIYAHAGNEGFDRSRYPDNFRADADGILPLTDERWFEGDATTRVQEFLVAIWGAEALEVNSVWLAASLGMKGGETPDETIRRYLADRFYRDHLQAYKRRPIYWLFSSGKQGAFQALVYLHRYNEGTLARMRAEYVVPMVAKMVSRLDMLEKDVAAASSAAARTKLQKQIEALRKKQVELLAYDEKLRHYADMRITLDLDDGVKVNYARFGDLVAESKAICGGKDED